jgi:hypothetical protein
VWLALSSLQTRSPNQVCRLERVWVRWHDNSEGAVSQVQGSGAPSVSATAGSTLTPIGWTVPSGSSPASHTPPHPHSYAQSRVEYPTLSVLPPLKSLSVLDIDELDYLDEMSVLIAKSKDDLRELRVGISAKAVSRDFAIAWDGPDLHQVDHKAAWPGASTIGDRRLGGVLGVLLGRVFDVRKKQKPKVEKKESRAPVVPSTPIAPPPQPLESHITMPMDIQSGDALQEYIPEPAPENIPVDGDWAGKEEQSITEGIILNPGVTFGLDDDIPSNEATDSESTAQLPMATEIESTQSDVESLTALISAHDIASDIEDPPVSDSPPDAPIETLEAVAEFPSRRSHSQSQRHLHFSETPAMEREKLEGKLRLQTLELERVALSVAVLQKAFDWSVLTNLTILDCAQHDRLWVMLRRHFQPTSIGGSHTSGKHAAGVSMQYHLNLKKIHTDAASASLISFLKETLAPNTLETLFLQDRRRSSTSNVTIVRTLFA